MKRLLPILSLVSCGLAARTAAQVFTFTDLVPSESQEIRDYDFSGLARTLNVDTLTEALSYEVTVSLRIDSTDAGTVLGDYYAYLFHADAQGAKSVVLLNRVGTSPTYPAGYTDEAMHITLSDAAAQDIHSYRIALGGPTQPPLGAPLTGTWQPDGRSASPLTVSYDSPRTQALSDFGSLNPLGEWSLFVSDVSFGGVGKLTEWSITFTAVPVPEPGTMTLWSCFGALAAVLAWRRRGGR